MKRRLAIASLALFSTTVFGMGQPLPKEETKIQEPQSIENTAVLKEVFDSMTREIKTVETLVASQSYNEALKLSKDLLDVVRTRTGIHPKAKIRERIQVSGILKAGDAGKTFEQLTNNQQEALAKAVLEHRGGLYFDILNHTKRATLLYQKAFYQRLKQDGELLESDRNKIWADLLEISNIPLIIKDTAVNTELMIFDNYVANSDQQYLFNREIKVWALNLPAWKVTEKEFDKNLEDYRNRVLEKFVEHKKFDRTEEQRTCAHSLSQRAGIYFDKAFKVCGQLTQEQIECSLTTSKRADIYFSSAIDYCVPGYSDRFGAIR